MCGLLGFIGNSKNPQLTYDVVTKAFIKAESRGMDACGFWAAKNESEILYHKSPLKASFFTETKIWQSLANQNPQVLIAHARQASLDNGKPSNNINNHPFVNRNQTLALIHNGKITEYEDLKSNFPTKSNCDSEIILRIIENETFLKDGIKAVFKNVIQGSIAAALASNEFLYLFKNEKRPLCLIDLREELNQIFFYSMLELWEEAVRDFKLKYEVIDIKPFEIILCEKLSGNPEYYRVS